MKKLMVLCLKRDMELVVKDLQQAGTLHLTLPEVVEERLVERASAEEKANLVAGLLVKFRGYLALLPEVATKPTKELEYERLIMHANAIVAALDPVLETKKRQLEELEREERAKERSKVAILADRKKIEAELKEVSNRWYGEVAAVEEMLKFHHERSQTFTQFGSTERAIVIQGWIPEKAVAATTARLRRIDPIYIQEIAVDSHDKGVPTKLDNPAAIRPFEFLIQLVGLPAYGELDPTIFFAITFPLFYGAMLGDIGYGAVLLVTCFLLYKKFADPTIKDLIKVIAISSAFGILFGALFGEFFGTFGHQYLGLKPLWVDRIEGIQEILPFTLLAGLIHVNLGLLVGFKTSAEHSLRHAILGKGSWFVIEIGAALIAAGSLGLVALPAFIGGAVILAGIGMLAMGEGVGGVLEIFGLVSNTLSYSRILAIGLASAGLALAINKLAELALPLPFPINWVVVLIVVLLGHGINIALGVLGPFIHSARLHYVEFFSKFYKASGKPYNPFKITRRLTEE